MSEMKEAYGYKANVQPTVLASTSKRPSDGSGKEAPELPEAGQTSEDDEPGGNIESQDEQPAPRARDAPPRKRTRQSRGDKLLEAMTTFHNERQELAREMHNQKIELLKEWIDVIKNK